MPDKMLRFSLFGESHGPAVGVTIQGVPPGIKVSIPEMQELLKRRWGFTESSSTRREMDVPEILSGIFKGRTTGAPITIILRNRDVNSKHYEDIRYTPRPGHSDYTAWVKYFGFNDYRGGGHFSGRITAGIVIAGYFARKILEREGITVRAYIKSIGDVETKASLEALFSSNNPFCPDEESLKRMIKLIEEVREEGDSIGGIVEVVARGVPAGLGGPYEDDMESDLARSFFQIPAVKGVEFGAGFRLARMKGSQCNDVFTISDGNIVTESNHMGGFLGGITNGMPLVARIAIKPTPSIYRSQKTVELKKMHATEIKLKGRFDTCIVPKVVVIGESMMALVLAEHLLRRYAILKFMENGR